MVNKIPKKGALYFRKTLLNARSNALYKGANEHCLFIKEIIIHKAISHKSMEFRAKGRMAIKKSPRSGIKLTLEEKPLEDLHKMNITGHCPPGLAAMTRKVLLDTNADFEQVAKLTYITTARGRYEQRKRFGSEIKYVHHRACKSYQKDLSKPMIRKLYLEDISKKYAYEIREREEKEISERRKRRENIYRINKVSSPFNKTEAA